MLKNTPDHNLSLTCTHVQTQYEHHTPITFNLQFLSLQLNNNMKVNIWPDAAVRKRYLGDPSTPGAPPHP